jgi:hypothetical protein
VANHQSLGAGPTGTLYGLEMMGALRGPALASGLAGLVLSVTGAFTHVLALSMAFSPVTRGNKGQEDLRHESVRCHHNRITALRASPGRAPWPLSDRHGDVPWPV